MRAVPGTSPLRSSRSRARHARTTRSDSSRRRSTSPWRRSAPARPGRGTRRRRSTGSATPAGCGSRGGSPAFDGFERPTGPSSGGAPGGIGFALVELPHVRVARSLIETRDCRAPRCSSARSRTRLPRRSGGALVGVDDARVRRRSAWYMSEPSTGGSPAPAQRVMALVVVVEQDAGARPHQAERREPLAAHGAAFRSRSCVDPTPVARDGTGGAPTETVDEQASRRPGPGDGGDVTVIDLTGKGSRMILAYIVT